MPHLTVTFVNRKLALILMLGLAALAFVVGLWAPSRGMGLPMGGAGLVLLTAVFAGLSWAVWRHRVSLIAAQRLGVLTLCALALVGAAVLWRQVPVDEVNAHRLTVGIPWILCLQLLLFLCFKPRAAAAVALGMAGLFTALPWLVGAASPVLQGVTGLMLNLGLAQLVFVGLLYGAARQLIHLATAGSRSAALEKGQSMSVRDLVSRREAELQSLLDQAQEAHRTAAHHESELRAMLDAFPGVVWRLEPSGVFSFANPHAAGMLGLRPQELVGQSARDWLGAEAFEHALAHSRYPAANLAVNEVADEAASEAGKVAAAPYEASFTAQDGTVHQLLMTQFVVPSVDGQAPRLYQIGVDIGARKRAELALEQAKAEAERANLAKSRFMSRMSHELRTPLNAVVGLAQLLRVPDTAVSPSTPASSVARDAPFGAAREVVLRDDPRQQQLCTIADAGRELLALVDETMDLSRMDAGEMRVACQSVNLLDLVHKALHSVAALAQAQGVKLAPAPLKRDAHRELWVQADPVRLRQVLLNLLSNAIKYNRPNGGVAVRLVQHGTDIQVAVQDTGLGLTPQQEAQLFQPYNRIGAENSSVPGSGVGLSIARGLVLLMGGRLEARSNLGIGSEFSVWLKSAAPPQAPPADDPSSDFGALQLNHEVSGRVLYVEDNEVNVLVFQACLARRPGVELVVARTAKAALDLAREQAFDLVVLDLNLPDQSGLELARDLRALPGRHSLADVPMVLFTADATTQIEAKARALGLLRVWHKPFDTVRLLTDIDQLLEPAIA